MEKIKVYYICIKDLLSGHVLDTQYLGTARTDKFDPKVLKRRY